MSDATQLRLSALRREYHAALAAARNAEDVGDGPGQLLWEQRAVVLLRLIADVPLPPSPSRGAKKPAADR